MVEGDAAAAGGKALLASRTNTLLSAPMVFAMLGGAHFGAITGNGYGTPVESNATWIVLALVAAIEVNAIVGKQGPMTTVRGVIGSSLVLTVVMVAIFMFVK